jgi:hypothetical protein
MENKTKKIFGESAWNKPFDKKQNEAYGYIGLVALCLGWFLIAIGYLYTDLPVMIIGGFLATIGMDTVIISIIIRGIRWIKEG